MGALPPHLLNRSRPGNVQVIVLAYVVRRLAWAVVLLLSVTLITFVIFFVIPSSRSTAFFRTGRGEYDLHKALAITGPVYAEYGKFVWKLGHGSLGQSFRGRQNVSQIIEEAAPVTASLVIGGAIMWLLIALPIGVLSALRPRSLLDRAATVFVLVGISVHPVWLGLIFLYFLGYRVHLFPLGEYCDVFNPAPGAQCGGLVQWFWHLILPWLTFAMLFAALYVRMVRAAVAETLDEDYVRTARAKGGSEFRVLRSHVLRNALLPIVSMAGMDIGIAMGGTLFIETVYNLPGLGKVAVRGLQTYDLPIILGVLVVVTSSIVVLNLVVDLLYGVIDPRVRFAAAGKEKRVRVLTPTAEPQPKPVPQSAAP
jgi:peptide/nickel transport system permease protein